MDRSSLRDTQYRPIKMIETIAGAGMSVRQMRDMAMSANNAHARACAPVISMAWPGDALNSALSDDTATTDSNILLRIPPLWVGPRGHYNRATWTVCASVDGTGSNCNLKLVSSAQRYKGPDEFTSGWFATLGAYSTDILQASAAWPNSEMLTSHETIEIQPNDAGLTNLMLINSFFSASANNKVRILSFQLTLTQVAQDVTS